MDGNTTSLDDWNTELSIALIPNNIILALYLILGICGNTLVILVYKIRLKKQSEDRYFIPFLAVSDLAASTVCASMGIALNMMQAEFTNNELCKAWWFFAATTTYMSILLLAIIAVHRYLKVCKPLGSQMSLFWKRMAVCFAFLFAVILGAPTSILYGSVEFSNPDGSIIGRRCSKLKNVSKLGSLLYGATAGLVLLASVTALIVFYGIIGCTIFKHFRRMSKEAINREHVVGVPISKSSESLTSGATYSTEMTGIRNTDPTKSSAISAIGSSSNLTGSESEDDKNKSKLSPKIKEKKKKKRVAKIRDNEESNKMIMYRFTVMFMVITIIFLVCYVPKIMLLVMEALNPKFWQNLTNSLRAAALFGYRLYILNNVVNPLVYAFMDVKFRNEAKSLLKCNKSH